MKHSYECSSANFNLTSFLRALTRINSSKFKKASKLVACLLIVYHFFHCCQSITAIIPDWISLEEETVKNTCHRIRVPLLFFSSKMVQLIRVQIRYSNDLNSPDISWCLHGHIYAVFLITIWQTLFFPPSFQSNLQFWYFSGINQV